MPYAAHLEEAALPQAPTIVAAARAAVMGEPMAEFRMPSLGADMEAGTLVEWLVKPGDAVKRGDIVAVVETRRARSRSRCSQTGIVEEIVVPEGEKVPVGTVLAVIRTDGEVAAACDQAEARRRDRRRQARRSSAARRGCALAGEAVRRPRRRRAAPPARISARDARGGGTGVDLCAVKGTGPDGAITRADVERAAQAPRARRRRQRRPPSARRRPWRHPRLRPSASRPSRRGPSCGDAQGDRRGDGALQARDPPLLSRHSDRHEPGDGLAAAAEPQATGDRAAALFGAAAQGGGALAAHEIPEINGFWMDGAFKAERRSSRRRRDLAPPGRPDRAGDPRCRQEGPRRAHGEAARPRQAGARRRACAARRSPTPRSPSPAWASRASRPSSASSIRRRLRWSASARSSSARGQRRMVGARPVMMASLAADHRASDGHRGACSSLPSSAYCRSRKSYDRRRDKALCLRELHKIAPEAELSEIDPAVDLREQIDLDSMDILNLVIAIHEATGVDIPEADYPQMTSLNGCVAYLHSRTS